MKRTCLLGVAAILLALPAGAHAEDAYVSIKGGAFMPNGKSSRGLDVTTFNDENVFGLDSFSNGYTADLALGFRPAPYVEIELGTGLYGAKGDFVTPTESREMDLLVIPATVTVKGILQAGSWEFFAGAGGGYYFATMDRTHSSSTSGRTVDETSNGGALGYLVTAGADYRMGRFALGGDFRWFSAQPDFEFTRPDTGVKAKSEWEVGGSTLSLGVKYFFDAD